jgi:hypothetical protein
MVFVLLDRIIRQEEMKGIKTGKSKSKSPHL